VKNWFQSLLFQILKLCRYSEAFDGVPWGLFLSTQELSQCPGGAVQVEPSSDP
jgi:hypothetical protein